MSIRLIYFLFCLFFGLVASSARSLELSSPSIVVLQYHHVSKFTPFLTSIAPEDFKAHLDYLEQSGFEVISISTMKQRLQNPKLQAESPRTAVITFDDAYLSVYEIAWPLLKEKGYPFSVFVNTQAVEQKNRYTMTWPQMKEMSEQGVEFANHTHSHRHMIRLLKGESKIDWLQRQKGEIEVAQSLLDQYLGQSVKALAYPFGEYNLELQSLLKEMDYLGFAQHSGAVSSDTLNPTAIPRFAFGGHYSDLDGFIVKVNSLALPVSNVRLGVMDENLIKEGSLERIPTMDAFNKAGWLFSHKEEKAMLYFETELSLKEIRRLSCFASGQGQVPLSFTSKENQSAGVFTYTPKAMPVGRSRFNCTLPSRWKGRFFWFSQPIIRKAIEDRWYRE